MSRLARLAAASALALAVTTVPVAIHAQEIAAPDTAPVIGTSVSPLDINTFPGTHPIKGNRAGRQASRPVDPIYHTPSSRWYDVTDPEECFATVEDAKAAGYRAPLR